MRKLSHLSGICAQRQPLLLRATASSETPSHSIAAASFTSSEIVAQTKTRSTSETRPFLKRVLRRIVERSTAGSDSIPAPHVKFLVRNRTGETLENSSLAAFHSFVFLKDEGGESKEAANFRAWTTPLASPKPSEKFRPITPGSTSRRLVSCSLMKLALTETREYYAPHQIADNLDEYCLPRVYKVYLFVRMGSKSHRAIYRHSERLH